jgi:hypothetical protein
MNFSGRFKSRLEANVGIGGCVSPQPEKALENMMFSRVFCCREFERRRRSWKRQEESRRVRLTALRAMWRLNRVNQLRTVQ